MNGPVRHACGFNAGYGCFGPGVRANATVGRALRLILINLGGGVPGEADMAVAGHPGKYTFCVAENEEASPWEPLHVERGIARHDSAVTVVGISGFINTLQAGVADLAEALTFVGSNDYRFGGCSVVALNPAQARALAAGGLDKAAIKRGIYERSKKRVGDFERAWLEAAPGISRCWTILTRPCPSRARPTISSSSWPARRVPGTTRWRCRASETRVP